MGLPLMMTPDYITREYQFSFGLTVSSESEFDAKKDAVYQSFLSSGGMRKGHEGDSSICHLMENERSD